MTVSRFETVGSPAFLRAALRRNAATALCLIAVARGGIYNKDPRNAQCKKMHKKAKKQKKCKSHAKSFRTSLGMYTFCWKKKLENV